MPSSTVCATRLCRLWGFSYWRALLLWTFSRQNQQDTQRRSAPPVTAPIHTMEIWVLTSVSLLWCKRTPQSTNAVSVWTALSMRWNTTARGCAAWRAPSCCCSHSVAFAEQCVIPFTSKLRIVFMVSGVFFDFNKWMQFSTIARWRRKY